jgi:hypothetical protein
MIVNVIHDTAHILVPKGDPNEKELHGHLDNRYACLQKEIETQGFEVRYWPAIKDPLNRTFVAISQAHKQIVHWAMLNELPQVCIAEDDLQFFAPGAWKYFLSHKPTDFDIYLGGVFHGLNEDNTTNDWCGNTLYIVARRFYETFLSVPLVNHLDRSLMNKGKYIVCDPMVCTQRGGYSFQKRAWDSYERYLVGRRLFGGVKF